MDGTSLSVTTALLGLLAVSGRAIDVLWDLNTRPKEETAVINQALHGVRECRSSIQVIYKTLLLLESAQLPFPERSAWIEVDELLATLTDTVLAFTKLHSICETLEHEAAATSILEGVCTRHARKIRSLSARIRFHNLSMTMILTILKCPGRSDAERSRAELAHRITRLLTFNTTLSGRLRGLDDVFNAKTRAGAGLPNYAAVSQNAEPGIAGNGPACIGEAGPLPLPQWSTFSGLTLVDIPVLSMVGLPVAMAELMESCQFYAFAVVPQPGFQFTETGLVPGMESRLSHSSILGLSGESWDNTGMATLSRPVDNRAS
ncbi:Fc.00g107400.m01.CDS01 [Cosmosporella sp. VM-42]